MSRLQKITYFNLTLIFFALIFAFATFEVKATDSNAKIDVEVTQSDTANSGVEGVIKGVTYKLDAQNRLWAISEKEKTSVSSRDIRALAVYDESLYLATKTADGSEFLRYDPQEKTFESLYRTTAPVHVFSVQEGKIYYLTADAVYCEGKIVFARAGMESFALREDGAIAYTTSQGYYLYDQARAQDRWLGPKTETESATEAGSSSLLATLFTPRLSAPGATNEYYFSTKNIFYASGYGMPNCTAYAYGRAYEILGKAPNLCTGNAGKWYDYNVNGGYYPYGQTPKLGAIAVWANDSSHNQGHVAVVEKIAADGTITISESHYNGANFLLKTGKTSALWSSKLFLGFIYVLNDGVAMDTVATPVITATDISGGKNVSISCATAGATIYYTTDGSNPTTASKKYTSPFTITKTTTVKAIGVKSGLANSYAGEGNFILSTTAPPKANLTSHTIIALGSTVTLTSDTKNSTIYYTTDGTMPTTSSTKYSGGIPVYHAMIIRAFALGTGGVQSGVVDFQYGVWESPFTDLINNDWYFSDVAQAFAYNYVAGTSSDKFTPNGKTTRAMFVTILSRMVDANDTSNYECHFSDVPADSWYTDAVAWAEANSIINGTGDNKFSPNDYITREQACVIMINYAKQRQVTLSSGLATATFKDTAKISAYAKEAVLAAAAAGLVSGRTDGTFAPKDSTTRVEMVAMLMRMDRIYFQ